MNKLIQYGIVAISLPLLVACNKAGGDDPGVEYAPDMYNSKGYEPFTQLEEKPNTINRNGMNMREPVPGTIAHGQEDYVYPYPNTTEGYTASAAYKMTIERNDSNLQEGKRLFNINCAVCHGATGLSDGPIVAAGKFPPPPLKYNTDEIKNKPDGTIYHVITHGRNLMGSYAPMLTPKERWMVVQYVKLLAGSGAAAAPATDSLTSASAAPADTTKNGKK
jgi:mono/diheme cytochrome c family protein